MKHFPLNRKKKNKKNFLKAFTVPERFLVEFWGWTGTQIGHDKLGSAIPLLRIIVN
jgi:hypothetical protein